MSRLHGDIRVKTTQRTLILRRVPAALGPLWRCIEGGGRPVQMQRSLPAMVRAVLDSDERAVRAHRWEECDGRPADWTHRPDIVRWVETVRTA